jgi:hypothetical protein
LAGQVNRASWPGKLAGQFDRASWSGKLAGQVSQAIRGKLGSMSAASSFKAEEHLKSLSAADFETL